MSKFHLLNVGLVDRQITAVNSRVNCCYTFSGFRGLSGALEPVQGQVVIVKLIKHGFSHRGADFVDVNVAQNVEQINDVDVDVCDDERRLVVVQDVQQVVDQPELLRDQADRQISVRASRSQEEWILFVRLRRGQTVRRLLLKDVAGKKSKVTATKAICCGTAVEHTPVEKNS